MDIGDDSVPDPNTAFGELFENDLGCHVPDDVLDSLTHEIGLDTVHHQSSGGHPSVSEHDILAANLPFVSAEYLQQHNIGINEGANYMVHPPASDVGQFESHHIENQQQQLFQESSQQQQAQQLQHQQVYVQDPNIVQEGQSLQHSDGNQDQSQYQIYPNVVPKQEFVPDQEEEGGHDGHDQENLDQHQTNQEGAEPPGKKKKKKVVKSVEYFTHKNMENYMIRRGFKKKNYPPTSVKSISKAVLALSADKEISCDRGRIVSFGTSYEPENVIQEMERFWKFFLSTKKSAHTCMNTELLPMLIPMLLHFFFEMSLANLFPIARRIFCEFSKKFFQEDKTPEQYQVLLSLMKVTSVETLKSNPHFKYFMKKKYEFVLSEPTLLHLRRFLSKSTQPILVNLFSDRFKIRLRESKELFESFDWEGMLDSESEEYSSSSDSDYYEYDDESNVRSQQIPEGVKTTGLALEEERGEQKPMPEVFCIGRRRVVKEVINEVRNSVSANLPAISVYTVGEKPVCGSVSKTGSLLAFGLTEAGMRICCTENARDVSSLMAMNVDKNCADFEDLDASRPGVVSLGGHAGTVYGVQFHPRTKLLFSVGQDSFMRAWDLNPETPECKAIYRGHVGPIWSIDIPESGSLIATAGLDTTARIFLPERNEFVRIMAGHYFSVNTVKFHPNEIYIATGSTDKSVRLWSINDGYLMRMFTGSTGSISTLAFHESGKYLAGAGEEPKIIIWDLAKAQVLATLDSLSNCRDLAFNGSMLSAVFRNGMLQIFNLRPIVGGDTELEGLRKRRRRSIYEPITFNCFADSLFKVHYKDPGRLLCLGSDVAPYGFDMKQLSLEDESYLDADVTMNDDNGSTMTFPSVINPSLDQVHSRMSVIENSDSESTSQDSSFMDAAGKILTSKVSQSQSNPTMAGEDAAKDTNRDTSSSTVPVPTPARIPTPKSTPRSTISIEDLDAAIASVIDQSGGDSSSDGRGGTITMYASS